MLELATERASWFDELPGWKMSASNIPIVAVSMEVVAKYNKVRIVILLLNSLFKLEEPTMSDDTISGRMNSFSSRMNISPG